MLQILNNRYRIQSRVGTGGMAEVYRAEDQLLGRIVAIKVLRDQYAGDQAFLARFMQEARAAARLSHPNVVAIYDVGKHDDQFYIVMEYVEGSSLKEIIQREGQLTVARTISLAQQICSGLEYAHSKGIVHRDVKPQNIMVTADGVAKIADFGIARALGESSLSETGQVFGSVHYLSPEQARGQTATAASDVYSVGILLFEMLTGRLPFQGDSVVSIAMMHIQNAPPPLRELNPRVPPKLEQLVYRALAKDPAARWSSAGGLDRALRDYSQSADDRTGTFKAIPPAKAVKMDARTSPKPVAKPAPPRAKTGGIDWLLVGLTVITLIFLAGLLIVGAEVYRTYSENLVVPTIPAFVKSTQPASNPTPTERPLVTVPKLENRVAKVVQDELEARGFRYEEAGREFSSTVPVDQVIRQIPPAGSSLAQGDTVSVVLSKGKELNEVTRVVGMRRADAENDLRARGFTVNVRQDWNNTVAVDLVYDQTPREGTPWKQGEAVTIVVSRGPEMTVVPDVVGMPEQQAKEEIIRAHLRNAPWVNYQDKKHLPDDVLDRVAKGSVLSVKPAPGTAVPVNTEIEMAVRKRD